MAKQDPNALVKRKSFLLILSAPTKNTACWDAYTPGAGMLHAQATPMLFSLHMVLSCLRCAIGTANGPARKCRTCLCFLLASAPALPVCEAFAFDGLVCCVSGAKLR